ncbi:MAG: tyrosine-type recombinase/integrase [Nitrospinae bacterium]|nr:tyrosine-type recombinase/integrase [Nitrospinota bacterium]
MGLFKQSGSKVWWISFSHRGRQIRRSTGTANRKLAESIYCKLKTQSVEGNFLDQPKARDKTFEELVARYLTEVTPDKKPNSQTDDRLHARNLTKVFGGKYLDEITSGLISQYRLERRKKIGPCRMNRELSFLSAAFNKAIKLWGWHKDNPVSRISREKENKRVKYFSDEEFSKIFGHLADWVKPFVVLAKNTGLRLSNLVYLRWSQVNLKDRLIVVDAEEMKNARTLGIPLNESAFTILGNTKRSGRSDYVFCKGNGEPYTKWGVYRAFKKACIKAGFSDYRFHDLRHDFCSKLVQAGIDLYTVKELAGHKDIATTQRYAHLSPGKLKDAVAVLDYHSFIIVEKKRFTENP